MNSPLPLDDVLADAAPLLDDLDPLQAELWCSDFLGAFWLQGVSEVAADLLPHLEKAASPEANLLCHTLAAFGVEGAADAAERLTASGVRAPAWAGAPAAVADACFRYGDDFGDQESFLCSFVRDGAAHAVFVLVDHTLGGLAKDAFVVDDVPSALAALQEQCADDPFSSVTPVDAAVAGARLTRALAFTDAAGGDDPELSEELGEDFPATRAFARARVATLPAGAADATDQAYEVDALVGEFLAAPEAAELADAAWAGRLVTVWAEHIAAAGDDPRRMSPGRIEELLVDVTPGAVLLDAEGRAAVPDVARAWLAWSLRGTWGASLPEAATAYLGEVLAEVLDEFPIGYLDLQAVLYRHGNADTVDLRG
ncbi:hypothetical protein LO772_03645 [Yinghuangia sp. ASG 101]|uniref:hypothetical protein n=1 Tax=Yinghuangia sp. ASG 101 TaxID=2896848 RepID=UPI001E59B51D|nr:hypothetical protein [Yinghuangia sp. ASG 101]UGQ12727.1 hypothetical protein LO772_03645 [Yinghuangia sp. ASG 101]